MKKVKFKTDFVLYALLVFLFTALGFFIFNFEWKESEREQTILEQLYSKEKSRVDSLETVRKEEKESFIKELARRAEERERLIEQNVGLSNSIEDLKNIQVVVPKNLTDQLEYLNKRYATLENIIENEHINLQNKTATEVIKDLEEGDKAQKILPIQDSIIKNKDLEINLLEQDKVEYKNQLNLSEESLKNFKELNLQADTQIDNLKEINKNLSRKSKVNKILIPIGIAVGLIVGATVIN